MKKQVIDLKQLTNQFKHLQLTNTTKMAHLGELKIAIEQLMIKLKVSEERQKTNEEQIAKLNQNMNQFKAAPTLLEYPDIKTTITTPDEIQLDSYKSIPEFSGDKIKYRSWREQVMRRMRMIEAFKSHPKYEAALGIIRAKITNAASDILINNNTSYNIEAIIDRLDFSYADQRPLYVVEAEMTSIKQSNKSLQEYYDKVNQALNVVISKIVMTYKIEAEQKSLITETQQKAVRTFIMGLHSHMIRNILYGHSPNSLAQAFAMAQTVYYDNQHLQLDQNRDLQRIQDKFQARLQQQNPAPKYNPNFNFKSQQPMQSKNFHKPEPMEVDTSNRFKQTTNWRSTDQQQNPQMNAPLKRDYNSSRQHLQQPQKMQRINQLQDSELQPNDGYEGDIAGSVPEDLISNASDGSIESSAFLGE